MKKRLFSLGAIAFVLLANAQVVTYVGNDALVHIAEGALFYNGDGVKTVGTGLIDVSGNMMVVGNINSKFETLEANGNKKTDGGNIILTLTNDNIDNLRYGQLYIKGLTQENITGIVDKEYKAAKTGEYQQIALPFYNKTIESLSAQLEAGFTNGRYGKEGVLLWNNNKVRMDQLKIDQTTQDAQWNLVGRNASTAYYALGSKNFDTSTKVRILKGVPYADGIRETLSDAGKGIDFGTEGNGINFYREKYNTYLADDFEQTAWSGTYGKNIYQFGNPFLTNIDLGHLKQYLPNIMGVRVKPSNVTTTQRGGTASSQAQYITYTPTTGIPVGDDLAIIKPLETFVIKLRDNNTPQTLNVDDLRRFAYTMRAVGTPNDVTAMSKNNEDDILLMADNSESLSNSTVKQLTVIALDADGKELDRTYYVVYPDGTSGQVDKPTTQVAAGENIIGTFEEAKEGGIDESLMESYWLYINEANEVDFKGKEVPMRLYSEDIKSLKFEIKENAAVIADAQEVLTSGESFYIDLGDKKLQTLGNGKVISLDGISNDAKFGLYYGKPSSVDEVVDKKPVVARPSATAVVYDSSEGVYKLVFDSSWKTAMVEVYDMAGRLFLSQKNVKTDNHFIFNLPSGKSAFVVVAVSETGHRFSQKIVK